MNALLDQNDVNTGLAVLNTDTVQGTTKIRIKINPSNGGMLINTVDGISFTMVPIDARDENYRTCMTFVGSDGQLYPWVADIDGQVLVDQI